MTSPAVENLCEALEAHLDRHRVLAEHLTSGKECPPTAGADEPLRQSMLREQAAQNIQDRTVPFLLAFKEAAEALGLSFSPPPLLTELAAEVPQPFRDRFIRGSAELARLKNIIFRGNEINYHFIEEALRLVTANLTALSCCRPPRQATAAGT